ncbi:hypothetical protein HPP92_016629 [Vanilla planifolia]|uniref:Prefoldin subunit 3 n=1 Tax=Vanilla planifolia TaxID=51239 RepID=A0A835QP25_VANPL|nr:hypothetical protein HPP92_016629 [Vanilla planifolia]
MAASSTSSSVGGPLERRVFQPPLSLRMFRRISPSWASMPTLPFAFLQERLQQYKIVEMKLLAQQRDLQAKIPDIEKCLDIVATLQAKKDAGEALIADFEVSEGIYSRAQIEETDSVCLWLGANVMLEYSCDEADALLKKNLENAKASLGVLIADLQFLRDQVTVTQVTIARVYNWDVHQRRIKQATKEA